MLLLLALFISKNNHEYISELKQLSINIQKILCLYDKIMDISKDIKDSTTMFILGKGDFVPIALEGALKIKEISYIHAEGYSGSSLKHGPFALIEKNTPIILLIMDDEYMEKMKIAASQIFGRGGKVIVITNNSKKIKEEYYNYHHVIEIPKSLLTNIYSVIPLQIIAYQLSILKNINPDFPRNLAKVVTTF